MRGFLVTGLVGAGMLLGCRDTPKPVSPDCICTLSFASVNVVVVDTQRAPVATLTPSVTVRSTGRPLAPAPGGIGGGWYTVVSDGYKDQFALGGDTLHFTATSGSRIAAGDFVVGAPGSCHCHVSLVSGPDTLVLR